MRVCPRLFSLAKKHVFWQSIFLGFFDKFKIKVFWRQFWHKIILGFCLKWDKILMVFKPLFDFFGLVWFFCHSRNYNISKDTLENLIPWWFVKSKPTPTFTSLSIFTHNFHIRWQTHPKKVSVKVWLILWQIFSSKIGDKLSMDFLSTFFYFVLPPRMQYAQGEVWCVRLFYVEQFCIMCQLLASPCFVNEPHVLFAIFSPRSMNTSSCENFEKMSLEIYGS